jgi:hypothetical protein
MSAPLAFLRRFAGELRAGGIRFAVTSGMACVHYGLQQTTKYSDWIIAIENLDRFRALLVALENRQPPWRISYRAIFGAPLEMDYRAWQNEADFAWPVAESFALQHQRLATVARRLGFEHDPVGAVGRAVVKAQTTTATLALVQPPITSANFCHEPSAGILRGILRAFGSHAGRGTRGMGQTAARGTGT